MGTDDHQGVTVRAPFAKWDDPPSSDDPPTRPTGNADQGPQVPLGDTSATHLKLINISLKQIEM